MYGPLAALEDVVEAPDCQGEVNTESLAAGRQTPLVVPHVPAKHSTDDGICVKEMSDEY